MRRDEHVQWNTSARNNVPKVRKRLLMMCGGDNQHEAVMTQGQ